MPLPEYASFDAFVQYLRDDERTSFTVSDLEKLNRSLNVPLQQIRACLEEEGFMLQLRQIPKQVRGFTSSSHDRWFGPGSEKTHGGKG